MPKRKGVPGFGSLVLSVTDASLEEVASDLAGDLEDVEAEERAKFIAFALKHELGGIFFTVLREILKEERGRQYVLRLSARMQARTSAAKREGQSEKHKFLAWARQDLARNPKQSKNSLASRYARNNGAKVETLRRYLSDLKK